MDDSEADTAPQLQALMAVLQARRAQLEQQLDDIRVMLAEIGQHEQRCKRLLASTLARSVKAKPARVRPR